VSVTVRCFDSLAVGLPRFVRAIELQECAGEAAIGVSLIPGVGQVLPEVLDDIFPASQALELQGEAEAGAVVAGPGGEHALERFDTAVTHDVLRSGTGAVLRLRDDNDGGWLRTGGDVP